MKVVEVEEEEEEEKFTSEDKHEEEEEEESPPPPPPKKAMKKPKKVLFQAGEESEFDKVINSKRLSDDAMSISSRSSCYSKSSHKSSASKKSSASSTSKRSKKDNSDNEPYDVIPEEIIEMILDKFTALQLLQMCASRGQYPPSQNKRAVLKAATRLVHTKQQLIDFILSAFIRKY